MSGLQLPAYMEAHMKPNTQGGNAYPWVWGWVLPDSGNGPTWKRQRGLSGMRPRSGYRPDELARFGQGPKGYTLPKDRHKMAEPLVPITWSGEYPDAPPTGQGPCASVIRNPYGPDVPNPWLNERPRGRDRWGNAVTHEEKGVKAT